LESACTVLELNEQAGPLSGGVTDFAGRYLHDHLSLRVARARVIDEAGFQERFAPFFEGPTMRSLRMEMPSQTLQRDGLPAFYAHFVAEADSTSGFAVLRDCLRAAQRRDYRGALASALHIPRALPDIARLGYTRLVRKRLAFPAGGGIYLHVDFEQAPNRRNRVYLSSPDDGSNRQLCIDWDVDEDASRIAALVQHHMEQFWERNGLNQFATLEFTAPKNDALQWNENIYDIYHPAGTTRMAADPALGVVDTNLKIHGTHNAYVVGSSVFPSMGAANPTFTAMALALRLADFIDRGHNAAVSG
jgi:GMC oxidoreductase